MKTNQGQLHGSNRNPQSPGKTAQKSKDSITKPANKSSGSQLGQPGKPIGKGLGHK